jgi:biotin carboxylase
MHTKPSQYVLILGGEFPLRERILAGALRASKCMPIITLAKSRATAAIKFFDGYIIGDFSNPQNVLEAVKKYEKEKNATPLVIIPMNDFTVKSAAYVSDYYGINHNSLETVNKCRDKFLMKMIFEDAGLPVPRFGSFSTLAELEKLAINIGYPLVIKPRELAGSVGVIKVASASELERAFHQSIADVKALNVAEMTPENMFVVEEYIYAETEVSVEVFNQGDYHRVIAVTDKYLGPEPYFVEMGHSVPSVHTGNSQLISLAERACEALGIQYGIAHFEARITPLGQIYIIEVAARTGGDTIMDLVERAYGINPYELHVASYLKVPVHLPKKLNARGLSAVSFMKAKEGLIDAVKLPKSLPEIIVNLQVTAKPKDISEKPLSWRAREGSIEFFWESREPEKGFCEHLKLADKYTLDIFTVL